MYDYYKNMPKHPVGSWSAQCAIRLAKTLHQVGVYDPASYRRSGYANDSGWALRAEELYQWLRLKSSLGAAQMVACTSQAEVPTSHAIVYLRDCWRRTGQRSITGDHIDLLVWYGSGSSQTPYIMTAKRWPAECDNGIIYGCRDGKIRLWKCNW